MVVTGLDVNGAPHQHSPLEAQLHATLKCIRSVDKRTLQLLLGFVTNVGGFNAATQALRASGSILTERLGSTAR